MALTLTLPRQSGDLRELNGDQRGAVMIMGLGMSCFLIGALWFLIGVGDTIVFRDRMQEAADHATFTSAALHAKGMNFLSACNLILLAMIAVHILLGIIHDIALAVCIISIGFSCGGWLTARRIYTGYAKIFKPAASIVHKIEVGAAYGYPYLAAIKGLKIGTDYGNTESTPQSVRTWTFSTSMIPGAALTKPINAIFKKVGCENCQDVNESSGKSSQKAGLPVEAKKMQDVCTKIAKMGLDALVGLTGHKPGGGVYRVFSSIVGKVIQLRYCNSLGFDQISSTLTDKIKDGNDRIDQENQDRADRNADLPSGQKGEDPVDNVKIDSGGGGLDPGLDKWWGDEGPYVPWAGTGNGSPFQQVWGWNLKPELKDTSSSRVGIASRKYGNVAQPNPIGYLAQAEFYFDCTNKWVEEGCDLDDNAGYAIKWRARMHRLQFPEVVSLLSSFGLDFVTKSLGYQKLLGWATENGVAEKIFDKVGGKFLADVVQSGIEEAATMLKEFISDKLGDAVSGLNPKFGGIYH